MKSRHGQPSAVPKVGFVSLGCPKATVDSEQILTQLRAEGYEIGSTYEDSDLVIINTCGFIDAAKEESLQTIGEALRENGRVIVTGCLGAKEGVVLENHPEVLAVTGPHALQEVMRAVHQHLPQRHDAFTSLVPPQGIKLTPSHYAYIKISEGCNHRCTFCIIPSMRGDLVSRAPGDVLREAENLVKSGVKELLVVSQDTSAYGVDVRYRTDFWGGRPVKTNLQTLARHLGELGVWVRMHYVYPYPHVDELIPLMAEGKILPYLDIPMQHASPRILKAMKRPADSANMLERIRRWREICPEIAIRSTFIVGFPGETERDFEELLDFLREAEIDRAGCFEYSPVEGAKANALENQIPETVKRDRFELFMETQAEISASRLSRRIGTQTTALIDEFLPDGSALGRSFAESPEIDGVITVSGGIGLRVGDLVQVRIEHADEHDLTATVVSPRN